MSIYNKVFSDKVFSAKVPSLIENQDAVLLQSSPLAWDGACRNKSLRTSWSIHVIFRRRFLRHVLLKRDLHLWLCHKNSLSHDGSSSPLSILKVVVWHSLAPLWTCTVIVASELLASCGFQSLRTRLAILAWACPYTLNTFSSSNTSILSTHCALLVPRPASYRSPELRHPPPFPVSRYGR